MKTASKKFNANALPIEQLYAIYGGNDGDPECDPVRCDAYDAGLWVGEGLIFLGKVVGIWKLGRGLGKGLKNS
jgi:hypothetical protein